MSAGTPCGTCSGLCCKRYSIEVTVADLHRMSTALGVPAATFCTTTPSWEGRCPIIPSRIAGGLVNLVISDELSGCRFYRDTIGANCSIYSARPRSCAVYPFFGGNGLVLQRADLPCPTTWNTRPDSTDEIDVLMGEIGDHNRLVRELEHRIGDDVDLATYVELLVAAVVAQASGSPGGR